MKKRFICIALAALMLLCTACSDGKDKGKDGDDGAYRVTVEKTKDKIWKENEQTVVLPDDCGDLIETAGEEFCDLFEEATEIKLDLAYESEITVNSGGGTIIL